MIWKRKIDASKIIKEARQIVDFLDYRDKCYFEGSEAKSYKDWEIQNYMLNLSNIPNRGWL